MCEIDIAQDILKKQLNRLRDDKASGPDELVPRFLNGIRERIVQPLTLLFRKVVDETDVQWRSQDLEVGGGAP